MNNKKDIVEVVIKVITEDTEEICRLEVIQMVTGCLEVATNVERRVNPTDEHGNHLKCYICESILHFANMCPHKEDNLKVKSDQQQNKIDQQTITLLNTRDDPSLLRLVGETFGIDVLDSGCTQNSCR